MHLSRRRGLLNLDADVVIVCLDQEVDQALVALQTRMAHRITHQLSDREPGIIGSTVERWRRDRVIQCGPSELPSGVVYRKDHFPA
jgi:hypothetical protein